MVIFVKYVSLVLLRNFVNRFIVFMKNIKYVDFIVFLLWFCNKVVIFIGLIV